MQRTLVKSPPELWAELSDPAALARHLGELGEIRIVRTEPESTVEWAAENISGTVSIKPSGWGTKVTLSVTREIAPSSPAEPPSSPAEPDAAATAAATEEPVTAEEPAPEEPAAGAEPALEEPIPAEPALLEPTQAEPTAVEPTALEPTAEAPTASAEQPAPRRGLFARLFGRRRRGTRASGGSTEAPLAPAEQIDPFVAVREALVPETVATTHAFDPPPAAEDAPAAATERAPLAAPAAVPSPEAAEPSPETAEPSPETADPPSGISAELLAAEQAAAEQVTAVLTAALDSLGAAHHRPFSRA
ncbi:MAG TPA: hypothetical protein VGY13_08070 [Solirubrobacteraceae bacterium]|nr:hypothetical protein [Solirubrobacteraceae bacterium]